MTLSGTSEEQSLTIGGFSGTYTLNFNGSTTVPIAYNAPPATVQADLDALASIGGLAPVAGSVTVVQTVGIVEMQTLTEAGNGTYELIFKGSTTVPIASAATAATVQAALNALPSIAAGGGSVSVAGASPNYVVTFNGPPGSVGIFQQPLITSLNVTGTADVTPMQVLPAGTGINTITFGPPITGLTGNGVPIVVTTASTAGLVNGQTITITGVAGNTAANGTWAVSNVTPTTFQLVGALGNGVWTANTGSWSGGGLGIFQQPAITVLATTGTAAVTQTEVVVGTGVYTVAFGGSLVHTQLPLAALGIGGMTATENQAQLNNPFLGKGISQILADPATGNLYVADGDGGSGHDEVQTLTIDLPDSPPFSHNPTSALNPFDFTITFNGATTAQIPYTDELNPAPDTTDALLIQNALDALPTIGGVGGFVIVTPPPAQPSGTITDAAGSPIVITTLSTAGLNNGDQVTIMGVTGDTNANGTYNITNVTPTSFQLQGGFFHHGGGPNSNGVYTGGGTWQEQPGHGQPNNVFTVTFEGNLALNTEPLMTTNQPVPGPMIPPPTIAVNETVRGGPLTVVNGTSGGPGVWRYENGIWDNLTDVVSNIRSTVGSLNSNDAFYGPIPAPVGTFPNTPGPDDDYRIDFPQTNATWTSLALIPDPADPNGAEVLYAALGTAQGSTQKEVDLVNGLTFNILDNGVYWSPDPAGVVANVMWYDGNPFVGTILTPPLLTPDVEQTTEFSVATGALNNALPFVGNPTVNGNIKISVVAGGTSTLATPNFDGENQGVLNGATIFALVSNVTGHLNNVYVSTDGGNDWAATGGLPATLLNANTTFTGEGQYSNSILALNTQTVYVASEDSTSNPTTGAGLVFMTNNGGLTWSDVSIDAGGNGAHTSVHSIVQNGNNLLFGTDGGIFQYNTLTGAWTDLNGDLNITQFNQVSTDASDPSVVFGAAQSNGTVESTGTPGNLVWNMSDDSEGGEMGGYQVAVDPSSNLNVYAVQTVLGSNAVARDSTDGGASWSTILNLNTTTGPLVVDPINPDRVLVGTITGGGAPDLEQSLDGPATTPGSFVDISQNLIAAMPTFGSITAIGIAGFQGAYQPDLGFPLVTDQGANTYAPGTIYLTDGTNIAVTEDDGQTWQDRSSNTILDGLGSIVQLVVDPRNSYTVYAVRSTFGNDQVFESTDAGQTWANISGNLPGVPAWSLALDPRTGNLYIGTDEGVFSSTNGGESWSVFGTALPNVAVHSLELNEVTNTLVAGTYGRGVYELNLDTTPGLEETLTLSNPTTAASTTAGAPTTYTVSFKGVTSGRWLRTPAMPARTPSTSRTRSMPCRA